MTLTFSDLGLAPELLRAVADEGYLDPTPVQCEAIPIVLAGRDLLAAAQTGTGKTAAFVLPILQLLTPATTPDGTVPGSVGRRRLPRVLVVEPTRELALQVEESVRTYGAHLSLRSSAIFGGVGFEGQARALRRSPEIVVATPGRLLDHAGQGTIDLSAVEILVLDEADRLLDMGFIPDIRRIIDLLPRRRQSLLFSATFSSGVRALASSMLHDPATVEVAARNVPPDLVSQVVLRVDRDRKRSLLTHLIRSGRVDQALVFTRTKHGANRLAEQLVADGIDAAAIHGNKSQSRRVRSLADFKAGRVGVLVATDLAARGLDIELLPHVVNYELPMVASDYVHRIGRTGRAGSPGEAISLVCVDEARLLREIEVLLGHWIPAEVVAGFEPDRNARPEPIRLRAGGGAPVRRAPHAGPRTSPGAPPAGIPSSGIGRTPARGAGHGTGHASAQVRSPRHGGPVSAGQSRAPRPAGAHSLDHTRPAGLADSGQVRPAGHAHTDSHGPAVILPGERFSRRHDRARGTAPAR
jgi:ATP-dependent RNA helicase RhlE